MSPNPEADPTPQSDACEPRELSELMQTLPQELYDTIYDLTFTAVPGMRFVSHSPPECDAVDYCDFASSRYESPEEFFSEKGKNVCTRRGSKRRKWHSLFTKPDSVSLLHTDRESRRKFAASFFGGPASYFAFDELSCMRLFARLVDPAHAGLIQHIREAEMEVSVFTSVNVGTEGADPHISTANTKRRGGSHDGTRYEDEKSENAKFRAW